jgi:hypothetical protein
VAVYLSRSAGGGGAGSAAIAGWCGTVRYGWWMKERECEGRVEEKVKGPRNSDR